MLHIMVLIHSDVEKAHIEAFISTADTLKWLLLRGRSCSQLMQTKDPLETTFTANKLKKYHLNVLC